MTEGLLDSVWGSFFVACVGLCVIFVARRWLARARARYEHEFRISPLHRMLQDLRDFRDYGAPLELPIIVLGIGWLLFVLGLLRFLTLGNPVSP